MGLSAPRKRTKLSHDPNNTRWTSDTAGFGHKIMTSQGWQPGQYLGAKDASQAEFYTAANSSHIRVVHREDNLGIGMDPRKVVEPKSTGLDAFQDLLGRLNGKKDEEILKEQKSREDLKIAIHSERRWGSTRFVQGGFLIGDKIQHLIDAEADRIRMFADVPSTASVDISMGNKSGKGSEADVAPEAGFSKRKKKKKMKQVQAKEDDATVVAEQRAIVVPVGKSLEAEKRRFEEAEKFPSLIIVEKTPETDYAKPKSKKKSKNSLHNDYSIEAEPSEIEKKKRKSKTSVGGVASNEMLEASSNRSKSKVSKYSSSQETGIQDSGVVSSAAIEPLGKPDSMPSTPSGSQTPLGSRHAVRSRHIAQKRLAVLDTTALNQIFMIK